MPKSRVDKAIEDFIVIPFVVLIGIYITSVVIDSMLQLNNQTFKVIFTGVGGIPFVIYYFRRKISEYMGQTSREKVEEKSERTKKPERKWIVNTTTVLDKKEYHVYNLDLKRNENLVGEVSAEDVINVFLVNRYALNKFENEQDFSYESGEERTMRTRIDFTASKSGTWYLVVENEENEENEVETRLWVKEKHT